MLLDKGSCDEIVGSARVEQNRGDMLAIDTRESLQQFDGFVESRIVEHGCKDLFASNWMARADLLMCM